MKTGFIRSKLGMLSLLGFVCVLCLPKASAAGFSFSPSTVSNTYPGSITFVVTGLTNGEKVVLQKYLDANADGVIDSGDILCQQYGLTDGKVPVFHDGAVAVTNYAVPGDLDSTSGHITAKINLSQSGFEQTIVGNFLVRLSSPFGNFTPITNSLVVTNFPFGQSIAGTIVANTTNVANAVVLLFVPVGKNVNPVGGVVADASGNYSINMPPGNYLAVSFKDGFVADVNASPFMTLGSGSSIVTNLNLSSADRFIAGSVINASNVLSGIPGMLMPIESQNGLLAVAFTDSTGNFVATVTADQWKIETSDQGVASHGFLRPQNKAQADTTSGSVSNVTIALPPVNAIFYGSVMDGNNQPMSGISIFSEETDNQWEQNVTSDASGNYFAGASSDTNGWRVETSNDGNPAGYIFSRPVLAFNQNGGTNLSVNQAVRADIIGLAATNTISGHVQDANNNPIANVQVFAGAQINGVDFGTQANTDDGGNYSILVPNGAWNVSVTCSGPDNSLDNVLGAGTYQCPPGKFATIANNNAVVNFTVLPCGTIEILTTSPLPTGVVGSPYGLMLSASSCNGTFTWSVISGTPPPGITVDTNGTIAGTATTNGTYTFTVHVVDGTSVATNGTFSLTINIPPSAPTISAAALVGSGQFQMAVNGSSGLNYTVQMSTNLASTNWMSLMVTNPSSGQFLFHDMNATNPARFYRVVVGP
jgi:hypothetical protein